MEELCEEYYIFNRNCKIISKKFMKKYVKEIIKRYNASEYFKKINIYEELCSYGMVYNFETKVIDIYMGQIKVDILDEKENFYKNNPQKYVSKVNRTLIYFLTHECFHIIQNNLIRQDTDNPSLVSRLFNDSLSIMEYNKELYYQHYESIPLETSADIMSYLVGTSFLNLRATTRTKELNNRYAAKEILKIYSINGLYVYPTELFYKMIGEEEKYKELTNNLKKSNYKRLILGLPIDEYYFNILENINNGNTKVEDVRKYLKKM